ncbi:Negative elongation factor D [Merluccius polli]|uniref:Negative elongation factor D n=1 Tax=Merluccius polli TaxID=89951 RepID=A0AA47MST9_MERPO|nr:Negative elongation factor D [Merluccius polli]
MDEEYYSGAGDWEDGGNMDGYVEGENDGKIQEDCLKKFTSRDYIMEPAVFNTLKTRISRTCYPALVGKLFCGVEPAQVQERVENHLKSLLIKHFDPQKADSIFTVEGETPAWLEQMIAHTTWRDLFYKLAEAHPDCLMLNFTVKLISDAGYQGEITSVSTACQQLEVFSRVLRTSLATLLDGGEENLEKNLPEFAKMVCHGEHTYLFAQSMMSILSQEEQGGSAMRRIGQEVQKSAHQRGHDASQITLALGTAAAYPRACQALGAMLSKGALNPADITVLFKMFSSMDPPPVELIRVPAFLDLFMQSLFKPGSKINQDHKHKYIHILAYAASVVETWKKNKRVNINKDELKSTSKAIETVHNLCCNENKGATELVAELGTLYQCIRFPVVAMGVLKWVDWTVSEPRYFQLQTDHTPVHLALLDEICTCHQLLHPQVLQLLIKLFETEHSQLDVMEQLELKKTLLDRMVHLLSRGYVLPVVGYIRKCLEKLNTDISLIRYFVTEVLDVIAPPYTSDFVQLFLPILENDSIAGTIRTEGEHDPVAEFIVSIPMVSRSRLLGTYPWLPPGVAYDPVLHAVLHSPARHRHDVVDVGALDVLRVKAAGFIWDPVFVGVFPDPRMVPAVAGPRFPTVDHILDRQSQDLGMSDRLSSSWGRGVVLWGKQHISIRALAFSQQLKLRVRRPDGSSPLSEVAAPRRGSVARPPRVEEQPRRGARRQGRQGRQDHQASRHHAETQPWTRNVEEEMMWTSPELAHRHVRLHKDRLQTSRLRLQSRSMPSPAMPLLTLKGDTLFSMASSEAWPNRAMSRATPKPVARSP